MWLKKHVAVVTALLVVVLVKCEPESSSDSQQCASSIDACQAPPEGVWAVENLFPAVAFPDSEVLATIDGVDYVNTLKGNFTLTKASDTIYTGLGIIDVFVRAKQKGAEIRIVALFDPLTCILSGTAYGANMASEVFRWECRGKSMGGPHVGVIDGNLPLPLTGFNNCIYTG